MEKHIEYYNQKVKAYRELGDKIKSLKAYFYIQERYYYNKISDSIEYKELNTLYNYVLNELRIIQDKFEINDIEDIFAYVIFLLNSNYLSYDENLDYQSNRINSNEIPILSSLVLNKHSKCRHNSSFLCDLIGNEYYKSYILAGIKEELNELLAHKSISHDNPNHAIVVAENDEYSYLLDPSTNELFIQTYEDELLSERFTRFTICKDKLVPLGDKIHFELLLNQEIKPLKRAREKIDNRLTMLSKNEFEFKEFNQRIKPTLYDAEKVYQRIIKG